MGAADVDWKDPAAEAAWIGEQLHARVVMVPDVGTNEQVMAWMMDTYSVHTGYTVPSIVTGKPLGIGGSLGRKESTGRGVGYLVGRAMDAVGVPVTGARAGRRLQQLHHLPVRARPSLEQATFAAIVLERANPDGEPDDEEQHAGQRGAHRAIGHYTASAK